MVKTFKKILSMATVIFMLTALLAVPPAFAADDAATITFDMISGEAPTAVTQKLNLISTVGSTAVIWASNNTSVIAADGTVTRSANDTKVVLSAMVGQTTKSFEVVVPGTSTTVGSSEGYTKSSDLTEYVIESSSSPRYGNYSEATGSITGSDAAVSIADGSMLISQTGTGQSRINRPIETNAEGLSGVIVIEKRLKASAGFKWYIKAKDNSTIAQFLRTGKTIAAQSSAGEVRNGNYTQNPGSEYVTYRIVLDTTARTYSVYINGVLAGDKFKNISFALNRNNVAKGNDWLEVYPRADGNTVNVDYSSVLCYADDTAAVNQTAQTLEEKDLLGANLSSKAVVSDLKLPTLINDAEISWSSNSSSITGSGTVTRGDADAVVTLTATFTKGTATAVRDYSFTVLKSSDIVIDSTDFYSLEGYRGFIGQDGETAKLGTGFNRKIASFSNPGKGCFSVEGRFIFKSVESQSSKLEIRMPGSPAVSGHPYPISILMTLSADNNLSVTVKDGANSSEPITNAANIIKHNEWFKVRIEFDTNLGKYYLYINDKVVNQDCMSIDIYEGTDYFTSVIFSASGDAYIDSYTYKKVSALTYDEVFKKNITVREGNKEISSINDINGNEVSVTADIFNPDRLSKNLYMIAASYLDGALYDCIVENLDITADKVNISVSTGRKLSVPADKTTTTIRCFTIERETLAPFDGEALTLSYSANAEELKKNNSMLG